MSERLTTLALALGALALFVILFGHGTGGVGAAVARPTTEEASGAGYRGASLWLQASGMRVVSLRENLASLASRSDLARRGNVLIVTLPGTRTVRGGEAQRLKDWIGAGNTLLVLAALADSPEWARAAGGANFGDLKILSGLGFDNAAQEKPHARPVPVIQPTRAHAYFTAVASARAAAPSAAQEWSVRIPADGFMLTLARERDSGNAVLWTRMRGEGRIIVVGLGSLFSDAALSLADNAQLFANIIGVNLGKNAAVVFDDFHQGLSARYDPQKFYRDPRLYLTSGILLALWFVWVLGATRLRVPAERLAAPREADLVRVNAAFLARVLRHDLAARRLFEHFFRRLGRRVSAGHASAPWAYLESSPRIAAPDLEKLKHWHAQACAGKRVPLVRLYNLIVQIERQMA